MQNQTPLPDQASNGLELGASKICFGCMSVGSSKWRPWVLDDPQATSLLQHAYDRGIRTFDTANAYSLGESERVLGNFIRSRGIRDEITLATKLFYETPDRPGQWGLGRDNIVGSVDASLRRLGVESIDLIQIHRWDDTVPAEEIMETLAAIVKTGKARFVGASNLQSWELAKAQLIAQKQGWTGFSSIQPHYNLIYREDERDLIPFCNDQGIKLLPWSPLARGRLARIAATQASSRSETDGVAGHLYGNAETDTAIYDALAKIAAETGEAPATVALAWLQSKGTFPIIGATSPSHIDAAARAAALLLSPEQQARLEAPYTARKQAHLPSVTKKKPTLSGAS